MAGRKDVRVEESLQIKIAEAKNLPPHSTHHTHGSSCRNTYCSVKLDSEEIFKTAVIEKSLNPFYGEEFQGEIPKKFRFLSIYMHDNSIKDKILGKVSLRKEVLHKYHGKDHWFPISPVDANSEVQGKVHLEVRFDEYLNTEPDSPMCHRMTVRVKECSDLMIINGACNPYAVVTLSHGKNRPREEVKRTNVRKKTICPQFDETFFFDLENRNQSFDRSQYSIDDVFNGELSVSLWHDDSRVSREVLGGMFPGAFLGELKISLRDFDSRSVHNAWYFLRARDSCRSTRQELGSIRLKIKYTADHVFSTNYYNELRAHLLESPDVTPISSSAAYILGEVVENRQEAAQPLMRLFIHKRRLVPLIRSLAKWEMVKNSDPNTLFRGNTLITKLVDELMKLVGLSYLHNTLQATIDEICDDIRSCEIDSTKIKDGENINDNLELLKSYVQKVLLALTTSGLDCPMIMCEVMCAVREAATNHFQDIKEVRYQVVSGFIFLRFFAPAILGPRLFDLRSHPQDPVASRTLTLVSKAIQGLGNLVSSKTTSFGIKEDYMVPLFQWLSDRAHIDAVKQFLDIISAGVRARSNCIEAPITLKEGNMTKRAQGRKLFGVKNFKRRHFRLTNQSLSYSKAKGEEALCEIPIEDILAVESLQEESFRMKYMFQVVQTERALYIQANNCIEEQEWLNILTKVCNTNQKRLNVYHPAAYIGGRWLCCKDCDSLAEGCTPVSSGQHLADVCADIDSDREVEKIHSLLLSRMEKLEALQDVCASQEVYSGENKQPSLVVIDDTKSCFETLNNILKHVISLEQEHFQHRKMLQRERVMGSIETPYGDESYEKRSSNTNL